MAKAKEQFSQIGYLTVSESAAGTLTFAGLSVFSNVLGQKGMVIHRAEYFRLPAAIGLLIADDDRLEFGISGSNSMTDIDLDDPEVYDYNLCIMEAYGTAANILEFQDPILKDWSNLPGGGLLVPADRLYMWIRGSSLASAASMSVRFWYTILDLSAQDYLELAQALRVLK